MPQRRPRRAKGSSRKGLLGAALCPFSPCLRLAFRGRKGKTSSEEGLLEGFPEVAVRLLGRDPSPGRAVDEADHDEVGLVDVLEVRDLFPDRGGDGLEAHRPSAVALDDGLEVADVDVVEPELVDMEGGERHPRDLLVDRLVAEEGGEVPHPLVEAVGDPWGAAAPLGEDPDASLVDGGPDDPRGAADDVLDLLLAIKVQLRGNAEAVAERGGEVARPRGGAHEGEGREGQRQGPRRALAVHHDLEAEVLHRPVEHLLDGP